MANMCGLSGQGNSSSGLLLLFCLPGAKSCVCPGKGCARCSKSKHCTDCGGPDRDASHEACMRGCLSMRIHESVSAGRVFRVAIVQYRNVPSRRRSISFGGRNVSTHIPWWWARRFYLAFRVFYRTGKIKSVRMNTQFTNLVSVSEQHTAYRENRTSPPSVTMPRVPTSS